MERETRPTEESSPHQQPRRARRVRNLTPVAAAESVVTSSNGC